ncbi:hypothetical protein BU17DRAFT_60269 [Hysterangium stoloniferum]|nr:hypothetical protein BU17DRAFT_60269 [Hysterangium stoloniferum]
MVKSIIEALTLLSLSVAVHSLVIDYGAAQQCGVVEIAWTQFSTLPGNLEFPLYLHILPFNSTAVIQPLDGWNASMVSGNLTVDFNFPGGTPFLFGVTDAFGTGIGETSTIRIAIPSSNTSCLSNSATTRSQFKLTPTPTPSDCPSATVKWNSTSFNHPAIIAFSPSQVPVNLVDEGSGARGNGSLTVGGVFTSFSRVVVLYDDGKAPPQTSELLTIGGTDRISCSVAALDVTGDSGTGTNPGEVIGYVVASMIVTVIIVILIVRYQKKRLQALPQSSSAPNPPEPSLAEEKNNLSTPNPPKPSLPEEKENLSTPNPPEPSLDKEKENFAPVELPPLPEGTDHYSSTPSQRSFATSVDADAGLIQAQRLRHTMGVIVAQKIIGPLTRSLSSQPTLSLSAPPLTPRSEASDSKSPVSPRRRSVVATLDSRRPSTAVGTDESYILMIGAAPTPTPMPLSEHSDTRPDSPTIPEASMNLVTPTTPNGGWRPRSQRSEKRSQYLKLDDSVDTLPSGHLRHEMSRRFYPEGEANN